MTNKIRDIRRKKNISQLSLSRQTGISPSDLSKLENGHAVTIWPKWRRILASVLEVTERDLFND